MSLDLATIGIAMDTSGLDKGTRSLKEAEKAADRTADAADRTGNSLRGMSSYADLASKALASIGLGAAVTQFMRVADSVTQLNNALKLSTGSAKQAEQAYSALYEIAQRSRVSFIDLGQTFTSLNRAGQEMGVSQQRMLAVTEAVGNAMAISGGSAQSMQAALVQLGQGMSSGVLRGEELNSVMEQAPRLAKALADGLNVPMGKLREMGAAGQITAEQVVRALESQSAVLSKEVAGATLTVGQAFTKLTNASTNAVGEFDKASGASTFLANAVSAIATAMDGMGAAFKNNEAIIKTVMGALAGGAALATLAAIPAAITAIGTALAGLGAILAAPAAVPLLALLGIGALAGGISAYNSAQAKTEEGIRKTIAAMEDMNKRGPSIYARDEESMVKWEAGVAQRKQQIAGLRQELALLSAKGIDTSAEDARLARHTANAKAAKADADAVAKLKQELSGIPPGYSERMAEIIRLNQKGALVGKDYTDALAAMQAQMLKKTGATKDATRAEQEAARASEEQAKLVAELGGLQSSFAKDWANLNALYAARKLTTEQLTVAQATLLEKQPAIKAAADEEKKVQELLTKSYQDAAAERLKNVASMEQTVDGLLQSNQAMRDEIEMLGLTEEQQTRVLQMRTEAIILTKEATLAELERQSAITGTQTRVEIALASEIEALKERNALLGAKGVKEAAKQAESEWARSVEKYDDIFRRGFADMLNNGKDGWKSFTRSLVTTFKTTVADQIYKMFAQPFVVRVVGSMMGMIGSNAAAGVAGQAGSSFLSSAGGSMLGNMAGGLGAFTGAMGSGFSMAMSGGMGLALEGGAAMLGSATGMSSALAGIGQIAGALGPIALGIGALYSIISSLDDSGTLHTGGAAQYSAARGLTSGQDATSYNIGFGRVEAGAQTISAVSNLARGLGTALDGIAVAFGQTAGYEIATAFADDTSKDGAWGALRISREGQELLNWENTRTSRWAPREFGDGEEGYKQYLAAVAKDTRQVLLNMDLPSWADKMLTSIGDSASMEQLTGVLTQIGVVQSAFVSLGNSMAMFANMTDEMQSGLLAAAGSIDALTAGAGAFYQGFYSEQERVDAAVAQLNKTLGGLKLSIDPRLGDDAKGQFRAAVEAAFAAGDAELATALLAISGNFANAADYFEQLSQQAADAAEQASAQAADAAAQAAERQADTMGRLQIDLLRAQGNETAAVALERERELAALTQFGPAAVAVQRQIYGLIDAMAAANAAASAYFAGIDRAAAERGYNEQAQAALDALFGAVNSGAISAAQAAADAAATAAASWRSAASSIQSSLEKLRAGTTDLTDPASRYAETKGVLDEYTRLALGGDASAAAKLAGAADAFLAASAGGTMTQAEYLRDRVLTEAKLASALESSEAQASLQESIATAARATVSELQALNNNLTGFAGDLYDLLRNSYPDVGRDGATTVAASLAKIQADFDAYFNATTGWAAVGSKYSDPSFGGASFTKLDNNTAQFTGADGVVNYLRAGDSLLDVAKRIPELRKIWEEAYNIRLPAFAEGGMHAGGLRLVGERGWEIEATGPARYWNQAQLSQALTPGPAGADNAEVVAELRRVSAQLSRMEARLAEIEKTNDQMAQQQDNGTDGGNAYRAEIMNVAALAQAIKEATV